MKKAIDDAGLNPHDIQYINAHGTSTKQNDISETRAIKTYFGKYAYKIPVSSIKSMTGHMVSAAGSMGALSAALTVRDNIIPLTINYEYQDPKCDLDYVPNKMREKEVNYTLVNAFGFGGQNVSLVVKKFTK